MKASEIRPCDECGGKLGGFFHRIKHSLYVVNPHGAQQALGEQAMMGALAGVMGTNPEVAVAVGDQPGAAWDDLILCQSCMDKNMPLQITMEERNEALGVREVKP